jgi:ABC-2 type transport system permease protein
MMNRFAAHVRFFGDYARSNFLVALEYRASFVTQVLGMLINDTMWVTFWWIYFSRFPILQGGWRLEDVLAMWAVSATGFGLCVGFFGNCVRLAQIIYQGELDYYLALPKNVLLHVLVSRMDLTGWGDLLFGTSVFILFLRPSPDRIVLFLGLALCSGLVFLAFNILWQSLSFWLGNAEGLATQMWFALITFSTYPGPLFHGLVRGLLFTVVPAAFVAYVPVELLRALDPAWLAAEIGFTLGILALAVAVFYRGLRRYESGNLMIMRA